MLRLAIARVADAPAAAADAPPAWLGDAERRRWPTLTPAARGAFAASRALLRRLLHEATGIAPHAWDISAEAASAPVARAPSHDVVLHASLSHRLGWVAAAVADAPVGIDLEVERPARSDPQERAALVLSPAELVAWQASTADDRPAALLTRWTLKEAWFKAGLQEGAPWDFRRLHAHACPPAQAHLRAWTAPPLHVAVCCPDAAALAAAGCAGLDAAAAHVSFWRVERAVSMT